jgi:cytosolic carboxypeptidase protein 2/3
VILVCDMHGHSRKQNIFMYGCDTKTESESCRVLPYILSKLSPLFDYNESRFGVQQSKEATARVALFKELRSCP